MRITGGIHRNRRITAPVGDAVRPSTDRTREALFNRLSHRTNLDGASVIDLFAGSGALGLEALSRGADSVIFVESSRRSVASIKSNIEHLDARKTTSIVQSDVNKFLQDSSIVADIILCDPPYNYPDLGAVIDASLQHLSEHGFLVLEHASTYSFDDHNYFVVSGVYGKSKLSFFQNHTDQDAR